MLTRVAFEPPTNQQSVRTEPKAQATEGLRLARRARSEAEVPSCVSSLERSDSPKGKAA